MGYLAMNVAIAAILIGGALADPLRITLSKEQLIQKQSPAEKRLASQRSIDAVRGTEEDLPLLNFMDAQVNLVSMIFTFCPYGRFFSD